MYNIKKNILLILFYIILITQCSCDQRTQRSETSSLEREREKAEVEAGLRRALTEDGVQEYYRLKNEGDRLRLRGEFSKAGELYRQAIHLYASALAVPYIKYSSFTHLGQHILHKYKKDKYAAEPDERVSFLEYEMSKTEKVHNALKQFAKTLNNPHRVMFQ